MKILMSIKPEYVDKILSGDKRHEFRRKPFKRDIKEVIVYSTAPVQRVVMSFEIKNIIADSPEILWQKFHDHAGMPRDDFFKYFHDCNIGYAIEISNVKELPPEQLPFRPPQSFMYINE